MNTKFVSTKSTAFQLKGSLFTLTVLQLLNSDFESFANQLHNLIKASPNFFKNAPVVIDLEKIQDVNHNIDFTRVKAELIGHGLIPVGIRNGNVTQTQMAMNAGLGILTPHKQENTNQSQTTSVPTTATLVTQPVRSGQQVYAKHADLIVLASVSPGAELLADGNIHVYGTLRGRALAGVTGNMNARIFCHRLEAELISIAGYYKLHDDIVVPKTAQGFQIYLEDGKFVINELFSHNELQH